VHSKTNEVLVADGYGNRRVIVFDATPAHTSGTSEPTATSPTTRPDRAPADRARTAAVQYAARHHGLQRWHRVCGGSRENRVQSFRLDGTFLKERVLSGRESRGTGTAFGVALSADPEQRFVYVADGSNETDRNPSIARRCRRSATSADRGAKPVSSITSTASRVDRAAISSPASRRAYRVQKFIYKGLSTAAAR